MGIFRSSSDEDERLSRELRTSDAPYLRHRRRSVSLAALSIGAMTVVSLYQVGVLRHLSDPPVGPFDSDGVDASGEAYASWRTPDAALGAASYAVSMVLASGGSGDRARTLPWLPLLASAKMFADALGGLWLTAEQAVVHRRFCSWCLVTAAASVGAAAYTVPEARTAFSRLISGSTT